MFAAIKGRGRHLRQMSVIQAFDRQRIAGDAMTGKPKTLGAYLDELKSPSEQFEDGMDRMFARLDAQIARQEARRAKEGS